MFHLGLGFVFSWSRISIFCHGLLGSVLLSWIAPPVTDSSSCHGLELFLPAQYLLPFLNCVLLVANLPSIPPSFSCIILPCLGC
ncbi:hypothetical protein BGX38DRAFT_1163038 [Terfezia claveryi]|nr:hypothetical protein BGX38DRAFT_1163038 [Terfezia claveryi]